MSFLMSIARSVTGIAFGGYRHLVLALALMCATLTPTAVLAQDGTSAIFGDAAIALMFIGEIDVSSDGFGMPLSGGLALTCENAGASAAQLNSGRIDPPGSPSYLPGLQMANLWTDVDFLDSYAANGSLLPIREFDIEGAAAPLAPTEWTTGTNRVWADAPAGSRWIYPMFDGDPAPTGPETMVSVYFGGWYIPTAEEASRMRVRLTYRADDKLVAVYLNDMLKRNNLLTTPITRNTSSIGTQPGVVELSGFVQGANLLSLVVHSTRGRKQAANYQGIAVAFDAYCYTPPPAPVPTLSEWSLMLLGLLAAGLGVRQVRRRT